MKYALVTGSTKGIGLCIARALINDDYFVVLNYSKSDENAEKIKRELSKITDRFCILKQDLSEVEKVGEFCNSIRNIIPKIDALILNAGATDYASFGKISIDNWNKVFNINLVCPMLITQGLADLISIEGRIIFIGSILGIYPHSRSLAYGVSKAAVHMLAKSLVKHFKNKGITVNTIAPGFTDTEWQKDKAEEIKDTIKGKIAKGRFANPVEIALMVKSVLDNPYINGQTLIVDGGYCHE